MIINKNSHKAGFSLLEMSIVIMLISIMVAISSGLIDKKKDLATKRRETENQMKEIEEAINLYVKTYRRLPCPADYSLPTSNADFAKQRRRNGAASCDDSDLTPECRCPINTTEQSTGMLFDGTAPAGTIVGGMVPVKDLGLPDEYAFDVWNNRIMYYTVSTYSTVSSKFITSHAIAGGSSVYSGIQMKNRHGHHLHPEQEKPAYVLISYGDEGARIRHTGHAVAGITFPCTATGTFYENCNNDAIFIDSAYHDATTVADRYKDIVRWKTIGRVIINAGIR